VLLAAVLAACGGDEDGDDGAGAPAPQLAAAAAAAPAAARTGETGPGLQTYRKVEDVVPEEERATIRHHFRDRDFMGDPTGSENRDPFRSYVINQPELIVDTRSGAEQTDRCPTKQLVASQHSMRDLRLVGIVSRGIRRFALFQDSGDVGHIVTRGDCVGKEKARVKDIGEGFVTLEQAAEQAPGQPPLPPEEHSIALYPEAQPLSPDEDRDRGAGSLGVPSRSPTRVPPRTPTGSPPARRRGCGGSSSILCGPPTTGPLEEGVEQYIQRP
jgi:hypothetical protein